MPADPSYEMPCLQLGAKAHRKSVECLQVHTYILILLKDQKNERLGKLAAMFIEIQGGTQPTEMGTN